MSALNPVEPRDPQMVTPESIDQIEGWLRDAMSLPRTRPAIAATEALDLIETIRHRERAIADLVGEENSSSRVDLAVAAIGRDRLEKLGVLYDPERDGDL